MTVLGNLVTKCTCTYYNFIASMKALTLLGSGKTTIIYVLTCVLSKLYQDLAEIREYHYMFR